MSNMVMLMLLRRMKRGDLTAHGFRSTFSDWAGEHTAYPREVVEMALAHAVENKVEAAYRRGDLFETRRQLMAWTRVCDSFNRLTHKGPIQHSERRPEAPSPRPTATCSRY